MMLFESWYGVARVLIAGTLGYVTLVAILRMSGKRTLSKMNAFDFIVTVALGSSLATVLLSKQVALVEGIAAFALLVGLQLAVTWASVRSAWVRRIAKSEPALLYYRGEYLDAAHRRERVTEGVVRAAIRALGFGSLDRIVAVVLETEGDLSVIPARDGGARDALDALVDVADPIRPPAGAPAS
jgi:uncharacterized membrane protein YcaP (DUF421 family)